jgi:hypothetical protein
MIRPLTMEDEKQIAANRRRMAGERRVVRRVVRDLLAAGFAITVDDGGDEPAIRHSTDARKIEACLLNTDDDRIYASKPGRKSSMVRFVYGNDAWEVICDYSIDLEDHLKGAFDLCAKLEARGR